MNFPFVEYGPKTTVPHVGVCFICGRDHTGEHRLSIFEFHRLYKEAEAKGLITPPTPMVEVKS